MTEAELQKHTPGIEDVFKAGRAVVQKAIAERDHVACSHAVNEGLQERKVQLSPGQELLIGPKAKQKVTPEVHAHLVRAREILSVYGPHCSDEAIMRTARSTSELEVVPEVGSRDKYLLPEHHDRACEERRQIEERNSRRRSEESLAYLATSRRYERLPCDDLLAELEEVKQRDDWFSLKVMKDETRQRRDLSEEERARLRVALDAAPATMKKPTHLRKVAALLEEIDSDVRLMTAVYETIVSGEISNYEKARRIEAVGPEEHRREVQERAERVKRDASGRIKRILQEMAGNSPSPAM